MTDYQPQPMDAEDEPHRVLPSGSRGRWCVFCGWPYMMVVLPGGLRTERHIKPINATRKGK